MPNHAELFWRCIDSITKQSFKDYEIIIVQEGKMAENTNAGIRRAKGELIKFLFMDDFFSSEWALEDVVMHFEKEDNWMISGCNTNPKPYWTDDIETGNNHLGSPSCLTVRRKGCVEFDESMSWLLDVDYYKRMKMLYGEPKILDAKNVTIGVHDGQMTNLMTDEEKLAEHKYMKSKWQLIS